MIKAGSTGHIDVHILDFELRILDLRYFRILDCGLRIADCGFKVFCLIIKKD